MSYKVTILDTLTIVFVVLKVSALVAWSWWFVISPQLVGLGIYLFAAGALALCKR